MPTPKETLDKLLLESSAAGVELAAALTHILEAQAGNAIVEARLRYLEALRRFGAVNSKLSALTAKLQRSKV